MIYNILQVTHASRCAVDRFRYFECLNAQVQVWLAPLPIHSCVGAIANRGQWEQGCSLFMATDLGPVKATREKKNNIYFASKVNEQYFVCLFHARYIAHVLRVFIPKHN